jgi:transketolase
MRTTFARVTNDLLDADPRTAVVLADISTDLFGATAVRHPQRVLNVGIREQLMVGVAGGLALTGLRPVVHSYATFAVDRAYEQLKLDLGHQGAGAVVVSVGASYDAATAGYTHFSPMDVALLDTLEDWTVHVPGHADEVEPLLRSAVAGTGRVYLRLSERENALPQTVDGRLQVLQRGSPAAALAVAVGPVLDAVLEATRGLDVTVAYTATPRPFDTAGLRELAARDVVLVEPYLEGTSSRVVADALADRPHRLLALGVGRQDLHRYGTPEDHDRWHGLDAASLRKRIAAFVGQDGAVTPRA